MQAATEFAPGDGLNVPCKQSVQLAEAAALYFPAGQVRQSTIEVELLFAFAVPAGQFEQGEFPEPSSLYVPGVHGAASAEPLKRIACPRTTSERKSGRISLLYL